MDNASYYRSVLTSEFLKRIGVAPMFSCEYHPEGNALAERGVSSLKSLISKLAHEKQREWPKYLNTCLWAIRESPSATTGVAPHTLVFGSLPRGPLIILKETWLGQRELANNKLNVDAFLYLEQMLYKQHSAMQLHMLRLNKTGMSNYITCMLAISTLKSEKNVSCYSETVLTVQYSHVGKVQLLYYKYVHRIRIRLN